MPRIVRGLVVGAALVIAAAGHAQDHAQDASYPNRPVRIIVPFAAGGPPDVISRIVGQKLSERWGQQVYVENHPGAGGNTGTATAARAAPDGYTLYMMSTGFMVNPSLYAKVPYDPIKDFVPVTIAAASPNILFVNPVVPARSVGELIALIKSSPGKYSYAQPSTGSTPHLSGELFKLQYGLDLVTVPFNGASLAVNSTIAGHTPIAFTALPPAIANIKEGNLRGLAVTAAKRSPALPDVPTMAEAGIPDQEAETINGLLAPAGTPDEIVARINRDTVAALSLPDVKERLSVLGFEPVVSTSAAFGARIKSEIAKWDKVVRAAHIRIE
ncbi:MAG TPA: tripartite tricarboxylate transporter substrate binding protein [Xanthobacteraceae bacterium]|jgi:tripartite-type tricarboxylate transporter receptor subunit TctC|nr:tripartite tricarboxylate transporter substrate binding protein [Xanthobacteraceae bacterium]